MQSDSSVSYFTISRSKSMPTKYNNDESSFEFHEIHKKQSRSVAQPAKQQVAFNKVVNESEMESPFNRRLMPKQRMSAWSSTSSSSTSSSVTTGSLFSLPDDSPGSKRYKVTGILFNNLDLVPFDPKVDPEPYACFNCWHFDHEYIDCPDIILQNYCRNCGRRGVAMKECPRCARAYMDYLDRSYKDCNMFVSKMEAKKPVDDVQLNIIEERCDENWDDFIEDDHKSSNVSFSNSLQNRETGYKHDDWDNYESPRLNPIKKCSKLYLLNAREAEIAKYKEDNWSDCEVISYSYSCEEHSYKTEGKSFLNQEEKANKVEDWDYFEQDVTDFSTNLDENNQLKSSTMYENESIKYCEKEAFKNFGEESVASSKTIKSVINNESKEVDEVIFEGKCEKRSTGICKAHLVSSVQESLTDQIHWDDQNEETSNKFERSFILEFKDQNLNIQNNSIEDEKEDWSDSEAYQSFQASFCEPSETEIQKTDLNSQVEEDYWTDFDDDYESLQASFAEEYKSLDNTMEDENDFTSTFTTDISNNKEKLRFFDSFYVNKNAESNELFSFVKNEKEDSFAVKQSYDKKVYQSNSLGSSVGSQTDEAYLSNDEDGDDYEYMIVDENERSETNPFAGQAVQDFLNLLDTLKHLPIQTQNIAVLHFISKQKEQYWQDEMQNKT